MKVRPHVKVHLSTRSHPRYREVFEDLEGRAIIWGLWLLAVQYHAAQTHDCVTLGQSDLTWLSGRTQPRHALAAVRAQCELMEYRHWVEGRCLVVEVRNLLKKQGFDSAERGATPRTPSASDSDSDSDTDLFSKEAETAPPDPDPVEPKSPARSPLLNLLAKQTGTTREKELWLEAEGAVIEAEAEAMVEREGIKLGTALKRLVMRYYAAYLRRQPPNKPRHYQKLADREEVLANARRLREARGSTRPPPPEAITDCWVQETES